MHAVTVPDTRCWGCEEETLCVRFYGNRDHRRLDICMWCLAATLELVSGFGIIRMLRVWAANRNVSIELKGPSRHKFTKVPKRFQHQ